VRRSREKPRCGEEENKPFQAVSRQATPEISCDGHIGTTPANQIWQPFPPGNLRSIFKGHEEKTVPLRTVTALSVARALCDRWAYVYETPVSLLTDNGPQFTAKFFQTVCDELEIKKVFTTAYHPQTNGQVERYNRTIIASLRGYVAARQDDWDDYTSAVTFAYKYRVHSSLGMPPF
jgi:hypothetical protein